ncbi:MAG: hypothetical protein A2Y24_03615 [Clostridiales bacterium GWE2_32_10]|nr:MAG: hypothetical protein A2Y24_03615 [Clostridiales bacterium GWE2_32_10]HBY19500.1 hypothetical protein [Clostridiales bacterium]
MNKQGRIIVVYGSCLHGAGASTVAFSLGVVIQQVTSKKVLVVNLDNEMSCLERFIEGDIEIKHSLDNIKIYEENLKPEVIENHSDIINENLYLISKSKKGKTSNEFVDKLIQSGKRKFDFIVIDAGNSPNEKLLQGADIKMHISEYNKLILSDVVNKVKNDDTIIVFNKFPLEYSSEMTIANVVKKYNITNEIFIINYDVDMFTDACERRSLYSFIIKNIGSKNLFINNMLEIALHVASKCKVKLQTKYERKGLIGGWRLKIF